ncbi:MAG: FtsQ-type POTRA domain-containing protein [Clostridia bacterium]|nr:FtsQ-type POTRA domain-containing protein [Clostridia bacterium]
MNRQDEFARKRALRQKKIRRRRRFIISVFLTVFAIVMAILLCFTTFFPVKKVTVEGSKRYTAEELVAACDLEKGDQVLSLSASELTERIRERCPYIETVKIRRKLPDAIHVTVTDAKVWAAYCVEEPTGTVYALVTDKNRILERVTKKPTVPLIQCKAAIFTGDTVKFGDDNSENTIRRLLKGLAGQKLKIEKIDVDNVVELTANVEGRYVVNFGMSADLEKKIEHLGPMIDSTVKDYGEDVTGYINLSWSTGTKEGIFVPMPIGTTTETAAYYVDDKYCMINDENRVTRISDTRPQNVPIICCEEVSCIDGKPIVFENDDTESAVQNILSAFEEENITVKMLDVTNLDAITVELEETKISFGEPLYVSEKVDYISKLLRDGKSGETIDLSDWKAENSDENGG